MPSCNRVSTSCATSITAAQSGPIQKWVTVAAWLVQIPHRFFAAECAKLGIWLPEPRRIRRPPQLFMPRDEEGYAKVVEIVEKVVADEGLTLLGWRDVPVDNADLSENVKATEPFAPPGLHRQGQRRRTKPLSSAACSSPAR